MRKVSALVISLLFCFSSMMVTYADGATIQKESNQALLEKLGYQSSDFSAISSYSLTNDFAKYAQLGYNKDDVSKLSIAEVEYLKDIEGELIGADVKYMEFDKDGGAIEISKEEYDQHKNNLISLQSICQISSGCSDTETSSNWMRLTTTIPR